MAPLDIIAHQTPGLRAVRATTAKQIIITNVKHGIHNFPCEIKL